MKDLGLMVVGLRKSRDEDEREKGVQLLVRVGCKRELLGDDQCDKAKKWELELQGTRLRQAARQVRKPSDSSDLLKYDESIRRKSSVRLLW